MPHEPLDLDVYPSRTVKEHNAYMVAKAYARHLLTRISGFTETGSVEDENCKIPHLKWMCEELINSDGWSVTKMHRWIGYLQGVLIARKYSTVQAERDDYRRVKEKTLEKLKQKDEQEL